MKGLISSGLSLLRVKSSMVNNPTKQYPSGVSKDIISIDPSILKSEIESGMITSKQLEKREKRKGLEDIVPLSNMPISLCLSCISETFNDDLFI